MIGRRRATAPVQTVSDSGRAFLGGVHTHFHGLVLQGVPTTDSARYHAGYVELRKKQEDATARRLTGALERPVVVESTLIRLWQDWCNAPDWYEQVVGHAAAARDAIDPGWPESSALQRWSAAVHAQRRSFSYIRQGLLGLDLQPTLGLLHQRLAEAAPPERERLWRGVQSCWWLVKQSKSPTFATCLNLAGQFGSGRSRLLAEMTQRATADGSIALLLAPRQSTSMGNAIHSYIAEGTGISVSGFQELLRFVEGQPDHRKLHIFVDDVHLWARADEGAADELQTLIDSSSEYGRIRWVFTADPAGLDAVSTDDSFFWVRHGHVPSTAPTALRPALDRTTGWLDVDASNRIQRLGFELLRLRSATDGADIDAVMNDPEAFDHEFAHLANPLPAWVRLESHNVAGADTERQPLTDVNSSAFVDAYWAWVKSRIARDETGRSALDRGLRALATAQIDQPGDRVVIDEPVRAHHAAALDGLAAGGLITATRAGDPVLEDQPTRVDASFPALMGLHVARIALARNTAGAGADLLTLWWPAAEQGVGLAESTCQFALTLQPPSPGKASPLWTEWASCKESPTAPLLMAAASCGDGAEEVAVDLIARARYRPRTKRELFVLTRFTQRARLSAWSADRRINALKPHVDAICGNGLQSYLHLTLTVLLESESLLTEANYLKVCLSLDGFPGEQIRELAADLLVHAGAKIYADDTTVWVHTLLRYCKKQGKQGGRRGESRPDGQRGSARSARRGAPLPTRPEPPTLDVEHSFAAALTTAFSRHVVSSMGSGGVRMLARSGWWTAKDNYVHGDLAEHMKRALTTQYGSTVHHRKGRDEQLDEYGAVARDLLNGRLLDHDHEAGRIAYYLLKHSVPTRGRYDMRIPEQFHPQLLAIVRNPELMRRLGREAVEFMRANGIRAG